MSNLKISYNGSEISSVDATSPVSVTYNDSTIATLNDGDIKTLHCNGKVMESDVDIGGKILNCNGKLMQGDIVVELVGSAPSGGETWYFNDIIAVPSGQLVFNFTSMNQRFVSMTYKGGFLSILIYYAESGITNYVYSYKQKEWSDSGFRTIVLDEPATGDVLAYLEANATKLS